MPANTQYYEPWIDPNPRYRKSYTYGMAKLHYKQADSIVGEDIPGGESEGKKCMSPEDVQNLIQGGLSEEGAIAMLKEYDLSPEAREIVQKYRRDLSLVETLQERGSEPIGKLLQYPKKSNLKTE